MTTAPPSSSVRLQKHTGWAEVILTRPDRRNAIDGPLGVALGAAINDADEDPNTCVVLLRGDGGSFCSGLDLDAFNADPPPGWRAEFPTIWRSAHRALFNCRKPIICALERYAINGGAALALAADILIAGEGAWLQVGEARLGMAAPYNLAWATLRLPEAVISRLIYIGDRITAPELKSLGIAHRVVQDVEVRAEAEKMCAEMATWPRGGLERIKAGVRARLDCTADAWFERFTGVNPPAINPPPRG